MNATLLIVDDEASIRMGLEGLFSLADFDVLTAANGEAALSILKENSVDVVISDLKMPKMDGEALLKAILSEWPELPVIILTGHGSIPNAVEAMRLGAYEFLLKPTDFDHLLEVVKKAIKTTQLKTRNRQLADEVASYEQRDLFYNMIGRSKEMQAVFQQIKKVAQTDANVLILGETGVGKELVAEAIHKLSKRREKPFVPVNCSAFSESLIESELFGHEKGAFTGAEALRVGRFEMADTGTLFLDEIGEVKESTQIRLLRVLQERELQRVGGNETIRFNVRLISATHRNLEEQIQQGLYRSDFYYRINGFQIVIPPLRDRKEDIPLLANYFLAQFLKNSEVPPLAFGKQAMKALYSYPWPGNIRELQSVVEQSAVSATGSSGIELKDLPEKLLNRELGSELTVNLDETMESIEKQVILAKFAQCRGNKRQMAKELGLSERNLYRKLNDYGVQDMELQQIIPQNEK